MPQASGRIALELEASANTVDGCTECKCRLISELSPETVDQWWFAFGLIKEDENPGWSMVAPSNHCGRGAFEDVQPDFLATAGNPYVVLELIVETADGPEAWFFLEMQTVRKKYDGPGPDGRPSYILDAQSRQFRVNDGGEAVLPVLVANEQERQELGVHEVLLRVKATDLDRKRSTGFGAISVSADVPGAAILLDGGFVGRVRADVPLELQNIVSGIRNITIRDLSGREASREIEINPGQVEKVMLNVLDLGPASSGIGGLMNIGRNPQHQEEYWRPRDRAMVIRIPAGEFLMGSPEGEGEAHERPQHVVDVADFLIDKTEVTWRQYRAFAAVTGRPLPEAPAWGMPEDFPASLVRWRDAQAYCEWAGGRLPSESEWEKAARGTDGRQYSWGSTWDPTRCNSISGGPHRPESVGSFPDCISPYGALDMTGSMWEWVGDWYQPDAYTGQLSNDPRGPDTGDSRVVRGGGWMTQPIWLRTAYRFRLRPESRRPDLGFRCAQDLVVK